MYKLRGYQQEAVNAGLNIFQSKDSKGSGLLVLPTGSGKSLIVGSIAKELEGNTIVLQPNKEILEQNLEKAHGFGITDIGVFSASVGRKDIGKVTFATIGSVHNRREIWDCFDNIIVDEAHTINSKMGMYSEFIKANGGKLLGLTATPYRMHAYRDMFGNRSVVAKMLTRTKPKLFKDVVHITQIPTLYREGYLCPVNYEDRGEGYEHKDLELNTTGMDFNEKQLREYNKSKDIISKAVREIASRQEKHILVFNKFVDEANKLQQELQKVGVSSAVVSAETPKQEREDILKGFKSGDIKVVTNVGTLTTGFDFPELDCIVMARPTQSVALYYQIIGRGIRNASGKECVSVVDLCGNVNRFGRIEKFEIVYPPEKPHLLRLQSDAKYLTGFDFVNEVDVERRGYKGMTETSDGTPDVLPFGKYKDTHIKKVPTDYVRWCAENFSDGKWKKFFEKERRRRDTLIDSSELPF